jgi:uncharacterized protein YjdB
MTARIIRHFFVASAFVLTGCGNGTDTSGGQQHTASVSVSLDAQSISSDATTTATAVYRDAAGAVIPSNFTWSSSNESVATVNSAGKVSAVSAGSVSISAATLGVTGTADLTVTASTITGVNIITQQLLVSLGFTNNLSAFAHDSQNRIVSTATIVWTTSNAAIVGVDQNGVVTGNALGSATITASAGGFSASSVVTVIAAR